MSAQQVWQTFCARETPETCVFIAIKILEHAPVKRSAVTGLGLIYLRTYVATLDLKWESETCRAVFEIFRELKLTDPLNALELVRCAEKYVRDAAQSESALELGVKYLQ